MCTVFNARINCKRERAKYLADKGEVGFDSPYYPPQVPELHLDMAAASAEELAEKAMAYVLDGLTLLWHFGFGRIGEESLTMRASLWRRPHEEVEDGLPNGRHGRLWRRPSDSFFSVPLL